jgi:hypothetical protein
MLQIAITVGVVFGVAVITACVVIFAARGGWIWTVRWRQVMQQLPGFRAANIDAFRSSTTVVTVKRGDDRYKVLQVGFLKDGSVFVTFPYFKHRIGLLSAATSAGTGRSDSLVNLEEGGKIASHLVKYSHHPSGLALFSQTGKIRNEIRRQSVPLDRYEGHLFTVLVNGLHAFKRADARRDQGQITPDRAVITFELQSDADPRGTLKIVGRWYDVNRLRFATPTRGEGPFIGTIDAAGEKLIAAVLANPAAATRHVLLITCQTIGLMGEAPEMLMFIGGFDPRDVLNDTSRDAGFLAFTYPAVDAITLKQKLGTVDFRNDNEPNFVGS